MTINDTNDLAMAEREIVHEHQTKEKITNEEYKIWKKTVPLLYDTIHTHALDFPSLTVKWLPDYEYSEDKNFISVKFLYGTNSSQHSQDYLKLGAIDLPSTLAPDFKEKTGKTNLPIPQSNEGHKSFQVLNTWKHNGEVNKLEVCPNNENVITFDNEGIVHLYNIKDGSKDSKEFKYHKLEGYALEWLNEKEFLSGSNDSQIALWEVSKPSTPIQSFKHHNAVINDLSLNKQYNKIFASVSDDYTTKINDLRANANENVAININNKHIQNAVEFHPDVSTLVATGGRDNAVLLYDLRNPKKPFRKLFGHNDSITGLRWDKVNNPNKLISWSLDRRSIIWDLNSLDEEFVYPNEASESSRKRNNVRTTDPCLKFISGGHTNRINEIDVHPKINGLTISCGDDSLLQVWKPKNIPDEEEEEEEEEEEGEKSEKSDEMEVDKEN
ncbi:histone acetyltransferase type B subunit 2 [[Candida] jaroonii]|uniref:Histone acetyltransferase type B subunit 2 n=1 Tax=[Candida] jaroonii TaxID=467808 RepID=A0ACA9YE23_9ASCO|nr:histone acetyltransferase type B subunit 2 [[Candida] jaroonii]